MVPGRVGGAEGAGAVVGAVERHMPQLHDEARAWTTISCCMRLGSTLRGGTWTVGVGGSDASSLKLESRAR